MQMPVMDGFTASRHIRDLEDGFTASRHIRDLEDESNTREACIIIALTADASTKVFRDCLDAGMDGVLTKPMQAASLVKLFFKLREKRKD
jgi:CheY-like chemotaxis protein